MSAARQSAFAKRRKLNNGSGEISCRSTPELSVDPSTTTSATIRKHERTRRKSPPIEVQDLDRSTQLEAAEVSGNSFEPLVDARKVEFHEIREIEHIDDSCVKVRLSQHQSCFIRGIGKLWVREGTVAVNGTALHASTEIHNVFSINQANRVSIEASSKAAEFQVESITPARTEISMLHVPGRTAREYRDKILSFDIVPAATTLASDGSPVQSKTNRQINKVLDKLRDKPAPTVLTVGQSLRNIDLTISGANHLLSHVSNRAVRLLDLDYTVPMFSLPGSISFRLCDQPMFGPAYAYSSSSSSGIVDTCWIGSATVHESFEVLHNFISTSLQPTDKNTGVTIVRLGAWIAELSPTQLTRLRAALAPDCLLFVGRVNKSHLQKSCQSLVTSPETDIHFIHTETTVSISPSQYLELAIQSHFYHASAICEIDVPLWYSDSLPNSASRKVTFSHALGPQLPSLIVLGGQFREQDVEDVLDGAFVILLSCRADRQSEEHRTGGEAKIIEFLPPNLALGAECLGLAYVEYIDTIEGTMTLNTPVAASVMKTICSEQRQHNNRRLSMLIQKQSSVDLATIPFDRSTILR